MLDALQGTQVATIGNLFKGLQGLNKETIVTKPKLLPSWTIEKFDRYKEEVNHRNKNSKDSDINKYNDFIEVLKIKRIWKIMY